MSRLSGPDFAESRRLTGERGARTNCLNCGSFLTLPDDVENGYGGDQQTVTFDCPRCRTVYGLDSANPEITRWEIAVVQNEHRGKRARRENVARDSIYHDPIYGPIKRAQDRLQAAERDLAAAMYAAQAEHAQSVRLIARNTGESKSTVHDLVTRERARVGNRKTRRTDHVSEVAAPLTDDIPF
jgi:DNA-directed RNA polymerase subunit M/transcription elongation factor TFIIS